LEIKHIWANRGADQSADLSCWLGRLPNLSLFGTLNLSGTRMFISGNFFTILGRALAFLSGIVEFYIFDNKSLIKKTGIFRMSNSTPNISKLPGYGVGLGFNSLPSSWP
jgi:hypothetical protein